MIRRSALLTALLVVLVAWPAGTGGPAAWGAPSAVTVTAARAAPPGVTIAYQPGIGYATLLVIKAQHVLAKRFPGTAFDWKELANGAAIRTGMIAGQIQFGAGGIGPFLIGWDRGAGLRLVASMNEMNLWLVTMDPRIKSLRDLKAGMKIGMPGPDSIQAIVLRKGAQEELGNAHALDNDIVSIEHPVGVQALLHGQLAAHLASPPFEFDEVQRGGHIILKSYDLFGMSTFNSVFTTDKLSREYPQLVDAMYRALVSATTFINTRPKEAAQILSDAAGGKPSARQFLEWMTHPGVTYATTPHGFLAYAAFMHSIGLLSKVPRSMCEIELSTLHCSGT